MLREISMPRLFLALVFCTIPLAAQSWDDLRVLKPGDRVKVQDKDGKERSGKFRAVSNTAISLDAGKNEVSVERARVRRVQIKSPAKRWRNVAIGLGIGVALALVVDFSLGVYLRNEAGESEGARALTYIVPIALFGGIA